MLRINNIASGSSGNSYLITDGRNSIILEAGVSIKKLMREAEKLPSIALITHEHGDHAKYADEYSKYGIKIYGSRGTLEAKGLEGYALEPENTYDIGGYWIQPFEADHDSAQPFSYFIESQATGEILLFATDTYYINRKAEKVTHFLVECNYDEETIADYLNDTHINRVVESHMSLRNLKIYLSKAVTPHTKEIYLCHLSDDNIDIKKAVAEIREQTGLPVYACRKDGGYHKL